MSYHAALNQYRQTRTAGVLADADPQRLIEMLLSGALDRLAQARGCIERGDRSGKYHYLASTLSIIEHLRVVLDLERGGDLARNLRKLYDYMLARLPAANVADDVRPVDEVAGLLRTIKSAWDALPPGVSQH